MEEEEEEQQQQLVTVTSDESSRKDVHAQAETSLICNCNARVKSKN